MGQQLNSGGSPGRIITAPMDGIILETSPAKLLLGCAHAVSLGGLCGVCGSDISRDDANDATINIAHNSLGLLISPSEAVRLERETASRLLREKKLLLILDLDQTILHATVEPTVGEWKRDPSSPNFGILQDVSEFRLPPSHVTYYIKLRPGTREFLARISELFEMHIYTMGTRQYGTLKPSFLIYIADEIAKIIDPDGKLFTDRVLSRDESGSFIAKSIHRLFPCNENMVVVVDDRGDVWSHIPNLIQVRPYDFFVGAGDVNEPQKLVAAALAENEDSEADADAEGNSNEKDSKEEPGADPTLCQSEKENSDMVEQREILHQIQDRPMLHSAKQTPVLSDTDNELNIVLKVMEEVHASFYRDVGTAVLQDSRQIMTRMRRRVLSGCVIVFSSVIPLGVDPHRHEMWIKAEKAGAICANTVNEDTTHVVAAKRGTFKTNAAKKIAGVKVVLPDWLHACIWKWDMVDETRYLLEPIMIDTTVPAPDDTERSILSGKWEHADDIDKIQSDEWAKMQAEVDEAMEDDEDDSSSDAGDSDSFLDNVLDDAIDVDQSAAVPKRAREASRSPSPRKSKRI
ncbi:MAG: hypothetical protein SGCHY_000820 [Lobulomycetales sp.]